MFLTGPNSSKCLELLLTTGIVAVMTCRQSQNFQTLKWVVQTAMSCFQQLIYLQDRDYLHLYELQTWAFWLYTTRRISLTNSSPGILNKLDDQLDTTNNNLFIFNYLNLFRAILCPSSGAQVFDLQHVV